MIADAADRQQIVGKALLSELVDSDLASAEDKQMAGHIFATDIAESIRAASQGSDSLDEVELSEDDDE